MSALQKKVLTSAYGEEFKCSMLQKSGENALRDWYFKIRFVLYNDVKDDCSIDKIVYFYEFLHSAFTYVFCIV